MHLRSELQTLANGDLPAVITSLELTKHPTLSVSEFKHHQLQ
jgi:hypothetical protein